MESCSLGAQREEQTRQQQLLLRGFPFNGLVFVLYIRKTVNNKYCVISLHLLLAPLAFCGGEGDREQHGRGCLRQLRSWEKRPAHSVGTTEQGSNPAWGAGWSQGWGGRGDLCASGISAKKG